MRMGRAPLESRIRRAYELGRLRCALARATTAIAVLAVSVVAEPVPATAIATAATCILLTFAFWSGRGADRAATVGVAGAALMMVGVPVIRGRAPCLDNVCVGPCLATCGAAAVVIALLIAISGRRQGWASWLFVLAGALLACTFLAASPWP